MTILFSRRSLLGVALGGPQFLRYATVTAGQATPVATRETPQPLDALLASCDSIFGIVVIGPGDSIAFQHNVNSPFVSASLYKLVLLADILAAVEAGDLSLTDKMAITDDVYVEANGADSYFAPDAVGYEAPLEELLYAAGAYSSNVAALTLMTKTSIARLNALALDLGMTGTHYWATTNTVDDLYPGTDGAATTEDLARSIAFARSFAFGGTINLTTPGDMAWFWRLLRDDDLISPLVCWRLRRILTAEVIPDRIPALLPRSANVIHKTGNLPGVLHDVGLIETTSGSAIVVAMAQAVTDLDMTFVVEQRMGLFGYELIADAGVTSPTAAATPSA